jgi:hypothetical protein
LSLDAEGLVAWDAFDALMTPGDVIVVATWRDMEAAQAFERQSTLAQGARLRQIRIIREYGMFDRREAPQYFEPAQR